ncbi:MAG: glycosyltransferase [Cyanobacteria bacterium J06631_9]
MKTALFVSIPFIGHLTPLLRQAEELVRRGWHVRIASAEEIRPFVEVDTRTAQSIHFISLGKLPTFQDEFSRIEQLSSNEKSFLRTSVNIVNALWSIWDIYFDALTEAVQQERPDVMIVDFVTRAGVDVAEAEGIPVVINNPDLLGTVSIAYLPPAYDVPLPYLGHSVHQMPWHSRWSYPLLRWLTGLLVEATMGRKLNQLRATKGLKRLTMNQALAKHHLIVDCAFGLEYPRLLPPNVEMVGPMLPTTVEPLSADVESWLDEGLPVVCVNLGTVAIASPNQIARMYKAFENASFRVWWILRPEMHPLLPSVIAPNIRIDSWGPPLLAVLRHANVRAFVSHCGINSVHESMASGTPIIGIPMLADQLDMAIRVKDAGVGLFVDKLSFSSDDLRSTIEHVMLEPTFMEAIPAIQASFQQAGGISYAADLIEQEAGKLQGP